MHSAVIAWLADELAALPGNVALPSSAGKTCASHAIDNTVQIPPTCYPFQ